MTKILKLRYSVYIDSRKLFFNARIIPHIDYSSVVRDGCSDVLKKIFNSLHRRAVKLIFPDKTQRREEIHTEKKLKEMRTMIAYTNNLNVTRVCSCTGTLTRRPQSI